MIADVDYPKESLVLVCQSLKPTVVRKGDKVPKAALEVLLPEKFSSDFVAYVVPSNGDKCFCPAWHARAAGEKQTPNVVLSRIEGVPVYRNSDVAISRGEEILTPHVEAKESQGEKSTDAPKAVATATVGAAKRPKAKPAPKEPASKHPRRRAKGH